MWIAEESLCAPLPAFWEDHVDDQVRQRLVLPLVAGFLRKVLFSRSGERVLPEPADRADQ
eukprot:COSAG04_NODE_15069_length_545_cov_0.410314_1_plen_59_part_01